MVASKNQRLIVISRIGSGRDHLSLPPSLSLQGDMGMGRPHSLLAIFVSAERQNTW